MYMSREILVNLAEDFSDWIDEMSKEYGIPKSDVQELIKRFLM